MRSVSYSLGALFLFASLLLSCYDSDDSKLSPQSLTQQLDSLQAIESQLQERLVNAPRIVSAVIGPGMGPFQALEKAGIPLTQSLRAVTTLADSVELVNLRLGETFHVGLSRDSIPQIMAFRYAPNPSLVHILRRSEKGELVYSRIEKLTTVRHSLFEGELQEGSTLDAILRSLEVPARMVGVVTGVLMCKVPFNTHARVGDRFQVLLEERWYQDSIWIEGKVLFARYEGKMAGTHEAFRYDDGDPKSTFNAHYTPDGEALVYSGMRYPLDRLHITSSYGMRWHPFTGRREMHNGVDYGSPSGAPVYSVAEGIVVESGYDQYSGNKVAVRHKDNSSSWYLHLSQRSVHKGQRVQTRQVIGRVGNTGRSSGPHLHFGVRKPNGSWMNPLLKRMIATPKLEGERLAHLKQQVQSIQTILESIQTMQAKGVGPGTVRRTKIAG